MRLGRMSRSRRAVVAARRSGDISSSVDPRTLARSGLGATLVYARAVRVLLVADVGSDLPFAREAIAAFADPVIATGSESEIASVAVTCNAELIVVAGDVWRDQDTALCSRLFGERFGIPVLCLCGSCDPGDAVQALRAGADDFLSIPFDLEGLVACACALVRRASSGPRYARAGAFLVDVARRQVFVEGRSIALTLHEYDVLAVLRTQVHRSAFPVLIS
jgi:DNA-binding NtrC family response regulator